MLTGLVILTDHNFRDHGRLFPKVTIRAGTLVDPPGIVPVETFLNLIVAILARGDILIARTYATDNSRQISRLAEGVTYNKVTSGSLGSSACVVATI